MEQKRKEQIALFRFGVISSLTGLRKASRGEREKKIREITKAEWDIPGSPRSSICRSTILKWISSYEAGGKKLEGLYPKVRSDRGVSRRLDAETESALVALRKQQPRLSLPLLLKAAKEKKILTPDFNASSATLYRLFERHHPELESFCEVDRRRFEAELPNDLWQTDCMHGPCVEVTGKRRKTYLFAILDDHSRLILHAEFYLRETLENFLDCFQKALAKRGLPRKLYLDNGPCFRSHRLRLSCGRLGIALIHAKAYCPQGKGKIERWFKNVRMQFLPTVCKKNLTLEKLNEFLQSWIENSYHKTKHSSTNQLPLDRFLKQLHLIRQAPQNLPEYFRHELRRKVRMDRTVSVGGLDFEAPIGLSGKTITLLFGDNKLEKTEVFYQGKSWGFLVLLNAHLNYILRSAQNKQNAFKQLLHEEKTEESNNPQSGQLFKSNPTQGDN